MMLASGDDKQKRATKTGSRFRDRDPVLRDVCLGEVFANGVAGETANDDIFTEFRDFAGDEVFDSRLGIFDEGLLEKADGSEEFVDLSIHNLIDDVGWFALDLCGGDVSFAGYEVGWDLFACHIERVGSRDVERHILDEFAENFVFRNEIRFAVDFDKDPDFTS